LKSRGTPDSSFQLDLPFVFQEDDFAFGRPARYIQLDPRKVTHHSRSFNQAVHEGSNDFCRKSVCAVRG
jgi:hypothetical protein